MKNGQDVGQRLAATCFGYTNKRFALEQAGIAST